MQVVYTDRPSHRAIITSQASLFDITLGVDMLTYSTYAFLEHHLDYYTSFTNTGKLN